MIIKWYIFCKLSDVVFVSLSRVRRVTQEEEQQQKQEQEEKFINLNERSLIQSFDDNKIPLLQNTSSIFIYFLYLFTIIIIYFAYY